MTDTKKAWKENFLSETGHASSLYPLLGEILNEQEHHFPLCMSCSLVNCGVHLEFTLHKESI